MEFNAKVPEDMESLLENNCKITDPDVITKGNAMIGRIKTESVINANTAKIIVKPMIPVFKENMPAHFAAQRRLAASGLDFAHTGFDE